MIQATDTKTRDLIVMDLAGEVPAPVNKAALRAARFRERHGVAALTVNLPADLLAAFDEHCTSKGIKKSDVIARLLKTQLLRKR